METKKRRHPIRDFFVKKRQDMDIKWFRNLCKLYGMDFWKYDIEELLKMYKRDKNNINRN